MRELLKANWPESLGLRAISDALTHVSAGPDWLDAVLRGPTGDSISIGPTLLGRLF